MRHGSSYPDDTDLTLTLSYNFRDVVLCNSNNKREPQVSPGIGDRPMTLIPTDSPRRSTETCSKTHRCCPRTRSPRMPRDDDEIFPSVLLSPSLPLFPHPMQDASERSSTTSRTVEKMHERQVASPAARTHCCHTFATL